MGSDREALSGAMDLFPERRELIEETFAGSDSFRALCRDYRDCKKALSRLRKTATTIRTSEGEYSTLLEELAEEIRVWLDRLETEP